MYSNGPSGGSSGSGFADNVPNCRLTRIVVRAGAIIDCIQMCYENGTQPARGTSGGTLCNFDLGPGEHVVRIFGKYGSVIDSITICTNTGRRQQFGGNGGDVAFNYSVPRGSEIAGIFGRTSSRGVVAIGVKIRRC